MPYYRSFLFFLCLMLLASCSPVYQNEKKTTTQNNVEEVTLTISAAASLQDLLKDLQHEFNKQQPNIHLTFNFAGSGTLQQQIINGAPVDIFIFADEEKAKILIENGLVYKKTAKNLLGNQLVLITPKNSNYTIDSLADLTQNEIKKIAIGTPEVVPAGKYTKSALSQTNLWNKLEQKLIFTKDVRQVLTFVENGNVDAGFVYLSDINSSTDVKLSVKIPTTNHEPILYSSGVLKTSKQIKSANIFYKFLLSSDAKELYQKHRFIVLD
ncbi:molybdate ABC transporter substrate-binding protein [Bacillus marasmi]|uniref:molybdate ABC transporter substrate-binding protein n=1 Tax=Bacillus marasmi TaxID=1926279 RepID=UPI0011C83D5C|nr:molybdate ABC transporter substrate-binding protein [Bacillus marasmi]